MNASQSLRQIIPLTAGLFFLICYFYFNSMRIFDFYDMAGYIDAAYRISIGQSIYQDFQFLAGPVYPKLFAIFIQLFGFGTNSILSFLIFESLVFFTFCFQIARIKEFSFTWSIALAILSTLLLFGPLSFPWYDHSAILFATAAIWINCKFNFKQVYKSCFIALCAAFFVSLSILSKHNIGLAFAGLFFLFIYFLQRKYQESLAFLFGIVFFSLLLIFCLDSPTELYNQLWKYSTFKGRAIDFRNFNYFLLSSITFYLCLLASFIYMISEKDIQNKIRSDYFHLCLLSICEIFIRYTSSGDLVGSYSCTGIAIIFSIRLYANFLKEHNLISNHRKTIYKFSYIVFFLFLGLTFKTNHQQSSWRQKTSNIPNGYRLQHSSLKNWSVGSLWGKTIDEAALFIENSIPQNESVLIFPQATILYGMTKRESYKQVPWMFSLHHSPTVPYRHKFLQHLSENPPNWILLCTIADSAFTDTNGLIQWLKLDSLLKTKYSVHSKLTGFTVLKLNAIEKLK